MANLEVEESQHAGGILSDLVFVAGAGRSGTTWLGKILDANRETFYKAEPDNRNRLPWFRELPSRIDPIPESQHFGPPFAKALEQAFWHHALDFVQRPHFDKDFLRNRAYRGLTLLLRTERKLRLVDKPVLRIPRWMFVSERTPRLVVKSVVSNLRLAWLHQQFPGFRIVLVIRHPGGYLSSWLRGQRSHSWSGFGDRARLDPTVLPFPRRDQLDRYAKVWVEGSPFERELIYWIVANETPILALRDTGALHVVVYEKLCAEPERVSRAVYEFCDLPFTEQAREFLTQSTDRHEEDYYSVFKNSQRVASEWRERLDANQVELAERYLRDSALAALWS